MGTIDTSYKPFDPLNLCSTCGTLERKGQLKRLPGGLWVCNRPGCAQERTALELDRANARQRPFRILPVPNARPQVWNLPDSYEGDEGQILNFLGRMVEGQARYESAAGGTPAPLAGEMIPSFGWIARYLYGLISEGLRPQKMLSQATEMMTAVVTALMTRQRGFGLASAVTQATDPWWGAFLESGAETFVTQDTSAAGLAMLYAYRLTNDRTYLDSAIGAASYLRNVQAIGSHAVQFTSSNAAGTSRLYTGAVASEVSTAVGIDAGEIFYSTHAFYPSDLLALEFWTALLVDSGDIEIGATGTASDAFISAPSRIMSRSISDMRECWLNGIRDSAGETFSGLSAVTPREFFNAYPATKPQFTLVGTGRWEFEDGGADVGAVISSMNFSIALQSLYACEGATEQVTSINSWLRSFDSNEDFELTGDESISEMARSTGGEYDPTLALATILLVRQQDDDGNWLAVKLNGSSLYDWGTLGCLSALWGTSSASSFIQARLAPLGRNQRFYDGQRSDGDHFDWITNRGLSGLSMQTGFSVALGAAGGSHPIGPIPTDPDRDAQGTSVEWNSGGTNLVEPGTHDTYDVGTQDESESNLLQYVNGNECPIGGAVYLTNSTGFDIIASHMSIAATATELPFYCGSDLTITDGTTAGFVRDPMGAWVYLGILVVVNDAVRAAQFAQCFRVNPVFPMSV